MKNSLISGAGVSRGEERQNICRNKSLDFGFKKYCKPQANPKTKGGNSRVEMFD